MTIWIAEEPVVFADKDGRRADGRIAIGLPTMVDEDVARCESSTAASVRIR